MEEGTTNSKCLNSQIMEATSPIKSQILQGKELDRRKRVRGERSKEEERSRNSLDFFKQGKTDGFCNSRARGERDLKYFK